MEANDFWLDADRAQQVINESNPAQSLDSALSMILRNVLRISRLCCLRLMKRR